MSDKSSFSVPVDPYIGQTIGKEFEILEPIGRGGMGVVYQARQDVTQRRVAVKLLHRHTIDNNMIKRFEQEARIISNLNHPNIVTVFRYGQHTDGALFIAMEYIDGQSLAEAIQKTEPFSVERALPLMIQMAEALGYAHERNIVHRDIKPENIVTTTAGRHETIKILDFGIAKIVDDDYALTKTGMLLGSPAYMAPEQWLQKSDIDGRLDIYALGCVFYHMLTGKLPFYGESAHDFMTAHLYECPPPHPAEICEHLADHPTICEIILRCVEKEPSERYQKAYTLAEDLGKVQIQHKQRTSALDLETAKAPKKNGQSTVATTKKIVKKRPVQTSPAPGPTKIMPRQPETTPAQAKAAPRALLALGAVVILAGILAAAFFLGGKSNAPPPAENPPVGSQNAISAPPLDEATRNQRGVTDTEITLGMSSPFSGPAKELGRDMRLGVETVIRDINAKGGIHGRRLKLVSLDDGYEPSRTVENMNDLLSRRKVFAIVGNVGTPTAKVAVPIATAQKTLFFGGFTGASLLRRDPPDRYVFNYRASYAEETAAMVRYFVDVRKVSPQQIAVFAQEDAFGDDGFKGVAKMLRKYGYADQKKILRVGYKRNTIDVETAVTKIANAHKKIKAIIMVGTYKPVAKFVKRLKEKFGRDRAGELHFAAVSFVGSEALVEEFQDIGPEYGRGVFVTQVVPHFSSGGTGVLKYRELLSRYFPSEKPSFVSLEGYIAMRTMAKGIEQAGRNLNTESLVNALESIKNLDLGMGTVLSYGLSRHQGSEKVWGTRLDEALTYQIVDLD